MALINCYECTREISDKAQACPHCGAPYEKQTEKPVNRLNNIVALEELKMKFLDHQRRYAEHSKGIGLGKSTFPRTQGYDPAYAANFKFLVEEGKQLEMQYFRLAGRRFESGPDWLSRNFGFEVLFQKKAFN